MKARPLRPLLVLLATLACAPAPPQGVEVDIAGEDALIVWDGATKTEHFIRRGSFRTKDALSKEGFGFLVPTPTQPTLAEADDGVFDALTAAIRPREVTQQRYEVMWSLLAAGFSLTRGADKSAGVEASIAAAPAAVAVLGRQQVAGLDAAILKATDTDALAKWLSDHGYAYRDALREWLRRYVENGWVITAFKLAPSESGDSAPNGLDTAALRMSFATDRPFYPYREPLDQQRDTGRGRTLRLFVVGDRRLAGLLGTADWHAELLHAAPFEGTLPAGTAAGTDEPWLHTFLDQRSPRPGTDELWFAPSDDAAEKRLPPIVHYRTTTIPVLLELWLAIGLALWWHRRRLKAPT